MQTRIQHSVRARPPAAGTAPRMLGILVLLAVIAAGIAAPALLAGDAPRGGDRQVMHSSRGRWWLDVYPHSMQEQAFIAWMDGWFGLPIWRHSMQERDVNALYAWWSANLWQPPPSQAED